MHDSELLGHLMQVTAFSRWEKELPKLVADDRFKAITQMKDRKAAFEDYCRDYSEQKKRMKSVNGQAETLDSEAAKSNFRSLLDEASTRDPDGMTHLPSISAKIYTFNRCEKHNSFPLLKHRSLTS